MRLTAQFDHISHTNMTSDNMLNFSRKTGKKDVKGAIRRLHGHRSAKEVAPTRAGRGDRDVECFCCGGHGHYSRECPNKTQIPEAYIRRRRAVESSLPGARFVDAVAEFDAQEERAFATGRARLAGRASTGIREAVSGRSESVSDVVYESSCESESDSVGPSVSVGSHDEAPKLAGSFSSVVGNGEPFISQGAADLVTGDHSLKKFGGDDDVDGNDKRNFEFTYRKPSWVIGSKFVYGLFLFMAFLSLSIHFDLLNEGFYGIHWIIVRLPWFVWLPVSVLLYWLVYRFLFDVVHVIKLFDSEVVDPLADKRPDVTSLGNLKHTGKLWIIRVSSLHRFFPITIHRELLISSEAIAQVVVLKNFDYDLTSDDMWKKMTYFMNAVHSINISRYHILDQNSVIQDSKVVAYFYAMYLKQKNSNLNCQLPGQECEGITYMDIELARLSFLFSARLILQRVCILYGLLTRIAVPLFRLALVPMYRVSRYLILTPRTPSQHVLDLLNGFVSRCRLLLMRFTTSSSRSSSPSVSDCLSRYLATLTLLLKRGWRVLRIRCGGSRIYMPLSNVLAEESALSTSEIIMEERNI